MKARKEKGEKLKKLITIILAMIIPLILTSVIAFASAQSTLNIQTDKQDYIPTDTVIITGSGFTADGQVQIEILSPISSYNSKQVITADDDGNIATTYGPPLVEGQYTLTATDLTVKRTISMTFTDKVDKDIYVSATTGGTITVTDETTGTTIGTVTQGTTEHFTVPSGDKITFTADPVSGFTFAYWIGDFSGNTNPLTHQEVGNGIGTEVYPLTATFGPSMVAPESAFGALAALGACFVGFVVFKKRSLMHL